MADPPVLTDTIRPPEFTELNDLACDKVGGKIIFATDDWFAAAECMLQADTPVFNPTAFTEFGKLMDGWESRRKRLPGHDWCIIQLGAPGLMHGVDVDTSFFTGNYAPKMSIQAASLSEDLPAREENRMGTAASQMEQTEIDRLKSENWTEVVPMTVLKPGYKNSCHNYFALNNSQWFTHLRLNIYPDGGVARLRVFGQVVLDWTKIPENKLMDLVAMLNGGICIGYSDVHFGHARNMIGPGRSSIMADGWETARRLDRPAILKVDSKGVLQVPGFEWAAFKLGHPGVISKIEVDTNHFKGNFPSSCWIEGCCCEDPDNKIPADTAWRPLLPAQKLEAHKQHYYDSSQIEESRVVSHVRVCMAPDGGISRVRLWGYKKLT